MLILKLQAFSGSGFDCLLPVSLSRVRWLAVPCCYRVDLSVELSVDLSCVVSCGRTIGDEDLQIGTQDMPTEIRYLRA